MDLLIPFSRVAAKFGLSPIVSKLSTRDASQNLVKAFDRTYPRISKTSHGVVVASYPGRVGEERRLSPPTRPGYGARSRWFQAL